MCNHICIFEIMVKLDSENFALDFEMQIYTLSG